MAKKNKKRINVVYSTKPDFDYEADDDFEVETLDPNEQDLRIWLDRKKGNKLVSVVKGFIGNESDLTDLGKSLKQQLGTGGTVKDGEILIQGDHRKKMEAVLKNDGYSVKLAGG